MSLQQILMATGGSAPIVPISLVAHTFAEAGGLHGTFTTPNIDTTGATLLVAGLVYSSIASASDLTDSKGNTWTLLTAYTDGGVSPPPGISRIAYCKNPIVGTGHNFTLSGTSLYGNLYVQAFDNTDTAQNAYGDVGSGNPSATSIQPGSLTPSANNGLLVTCFMYGTSGTISINSGFTITDKIEASVDNLRGAMAYKVQTTAQAENPTWATTGAAERVAAGMTSFFLN